MKRAAVYVRISDDKAGVGLGVQRQETDCQKLAESLSIEDVVLFSDNDVSAYSGRRRPGYEAMLEQLAAGGFSAVIAWHGDRLHRSPIELEAYIDIVEKHGVETHLVTGGRVDLGTPTGRMIARTVGNMARYESEHKAERIVRAHRQAAEQGRWRGGLRPFGYLDDGQTPHPEEAALVLRAYKDVLEGTSLSELCRHWNAKGIQTTTGRAWGTQSLKQLLLRERNYGASVYRGKSSVKAIGCQSWKRQPSSRQDFCSRTRRVGAATARSAGGFSQVSQCAESAKRTDALRRSARRPPTAEVDRGRSISAGQTLTSLAAQLRPTC
ncbi:recombinase family protein [Sinomonas atrocyanea]